MEFGEREPERERGRGRERERDRERYRRKRRRLGGGGLLKGTGPGRRSRLLSQLDEQSSGVHV
jgi:hypothetical protein